MTKFLVHNIKNIHFGKFISSNNWFLNYFLVKFHCDIPCIFIIILDLILHSLPSLLSLASPSPNRHSLFFGVSYDQLPSHVPFHVSSPTGGRKNELTLISLSFKKTCLGKLLWILIGTLYILIFIYLSNIYFHRCYILRKISDILKINISQLFFLATNYYFLSYRLQMQLWEVWKGINLITID